MTPIGIPDGATPICIPDGVPHIGSQIYGVPFGFNLVIPSGSKCIVPNLSVNLKQNLEGNLGYPIWVPHFGTNLGLPIYEAIWVPIWGAPSWSQSGGPYLGFNLGRLSGLQYGESHLGANMERPIWNAPFGCQSGVPHLGANLGTNQVCPICNPILGA